MRIEERKKAIEEEAIKIAYFKKELELATKKYNKLMTSEYKIVMFKKCIKPSNITNEEDKDYLLVTYEVDTNIISYKKIKGSNIEENISGFIDYTEYFKDYDISDEVDENNKTLIIEATFNFKDLVYNIIHERKLSTWEEVRNNIEELLDSDREVLKKGYYYNKGRRKKWILKNEVKTKYNCQTWEEIKIALDMEIFSKDRLNFHIIPDSDLFFKCK